MSEETGAGAAMEPAPEPRSEAKPKEGSNIRTIAVVLAVIALIVLAAVSYIMWMPEEEEEDEHILAANVAPGQVEMDAGGSVALVANASWNGESINEAVGVAFEWSVSNASLGTLSSNSARITSFLAGKAAGTGQITCFVTYLHEDEQFNATAQVDLTVNPPSLSSVTVTPAEITLIFDRAQMFTASAKDTVGDAVTGLTYAWTVEGIPEANYTLDSASGPAVNMTANITGTAWVNATATYNGITKSGSALIPIIMAAPTMSISWTNMPGGAGINWTCGEPTGPLQWDEVIVYLTDGTTTVNWSLTMGVLDDGSIGTARFGSRDLSALTVFLNVTDIAGNGSVSAGDFFTFTTSGGKFNPAKNYIVTLVYSPTIDVIAQSTFRG